MTSNSDNAARPENTFAGQINKTLLRCLRDVPELVLGGQLIKYGFAGVTSGLYELYPERFITYSVSESLMNSSAMGLALAGKRVCMMHVRMDFLASGMCALVNHVPIWRKKGHKLPIVMVVQEGRGINSGQGPQHSKDLTFWFQRFEGWQTCVPQTPQEAGGMLYDAIMGDDPTMYVIHRTLFDAAEGKRIVVPQEIKLCGSSRRHVEAFYRN